MAEHRVRRLPVLDDEGRLIGILSLDDILVEARRAGDLGHPRIAHVMATLQAICRPPLPAVRS